MGNASYRQQNAPITSDIRGYFQLDLPKFMLQSRIGDGKFLKSYVMRMDSSKVVVKVYFRANDEDLQEAAAQLTMLWKALSPAIYPNLLPYQLWTRCTFRAKGPVSPVYLIRQYFSSSLRERLSQRPFLDSLEKRWIIYQLLKCLQNVHENNTVHGDVKPENIMCTTSLWIVLTDFSPFKPAFVPNDDPTDFQYYFDQMGGHRCYLAPERFYRRGVKSSRNPAATNSSSSNDEMLNEMRTELLGSSRSMSLKKDASNYNSRNSTLDRTVDVFSAGCVMAEILLDGSHLLDLPKMLSYLSLAYQTQIVEDHAQYIPVRLDNDQSPAKFLISRISNPLLREVVLEMTQRDPDRRLSVQEYLSILQGKWSPLDEGKSDGNKAKEAKHEQSQGPASVSPLASSILLSRAMAHTKDEESSVKDNSNPFPDYFEEFVYPLFLKLHWNGVTPDERLVIICENYGKMMHIIANEIDEEGGEFFSTALNSTALHHHDDSASNQLADEKKLQNAMKERREEPSIDKNYGESLQENLKYIPVEDLMRRAQLLLSEAENSLEDKNSEVDDLSGLFNATSTMLGSYIAPQSSTTDNTINNQQTENDHHRCSYRHEGLVLIVNILASNFRHLRFPQSKMVCLMLLVKIGSKCTDDVILQRVIPTVLVGVTDQSAPVRAVTIRALRVLLSVVQEFSILEANLFPMYIFPALNRLVDDSEICVRIAFVESIGRIAEAAKKFLDRAHFAFMNKILGDDGNSAAAVSANQYSEAKDMIIVEYPYDAKLEQLREQVNKWIKDLMIDNTSFGFNASVQQQGFKFGNGGHFDSLLKRVLLIDIMKLCVFFGQEATTDKLLTRILTFLNDPDWELRHAFCKIIPSVCAYLGPTVTSECVLPCVENALYDVEERVVVSALKGIVKVVRMKLLSRLLIVEFSEKCKPLLLHPLYSLRQAAVDFFEAAAEIIGIIDTAVFLIPIIRDTLSYDLSGVSLSGEVIRLALLRNISRKVYHNALMEQLKAISDTTFKFYCNEKRIRQQLQMIDTDFNDQFQSLDQARHSLSPNSSNLACELSTKLKVELMKDYINHSAREINTKTRQWRMFKEFSNNIYHDKLVVEEISTVVSTSKGVLPNLSLSWNYRHMPDYSLQSLLVPHQKFGVSHFPGVSESARRQKMTFEADGYRNILKLRGIYGITGSQADAARALAAGVGDVWDQPQASFDDRSVNSGQQSPLSVTNLQTSETVVTPGVAITSAVVLAENSPRLSSSPSTPIPASRDADTKHTGKLPEYPIVKLRIMNPAFAESLLLWKRICALHIPPLPPDLGTLSQPNGKKYSCYTESLQVNGDGSNSGVVAGTGQTNLTKQWKPRENVLVASVREHTGAVQRLAVSQDHSFFLSASSDKTVRVWQTKNVDSTGYPTSVAVYNKHQAALLDCTIIENTHSFASASADGTIHVVRVDLLGKVANANSAASPGSDYGSKAVFGTSTVQSIESKEGSVLSVQHYNSDICSVLSYATERGGVHGWDLRASKEAFNLPMRPELGMSTCLSLSPDRNWICVGTSEGYLALWDIRFNSLAKLWRHSSCATIHRIACARGSRGGSAVPLPKGNTLYGTNGAYLFVAAGNNEAAVWGIPEGGECIRCFRSIPLDDSRKPLASLPTLDEVSLNSRHPSAPIFHAIKNISSKLPIRSDSIRSLLGRVSSSKSSSSYLITSGTDASIRYWDFADAENCYTVTGPGLAQPKGIFDIPRLGRVDKNYSHVDNRLMVCYVTSPPSQSKIVQSQLPQRESRGIVPASTSFKDAVLDMKVLDLPGKMLVAGSRDGEIKLWR